MSKKFISLLDSTYKSGTLIEIINNSLCLSTVTKALGYSNNGRYTKLLREFCISNNIDIRHFTVNGMPVAEVIEKICPQCNIKFTFRTSNKKETCSHACANKYFSYKQGAKNRSNDSVSYVGIITSFYKETGRNIKCCACEEKLVLDVHHIDENRSNNTLTNLVFICPNHHAAYHRFKDKSVMDHIQKTAMSHK